VTRNCKMYSHILVKVCSL